MTLDEAILHAREVAERNRKQYKNCPSDRTDIRHQTCEECAEEHEQLAEWLEELKFIRQWKSDIMDNFCKYDVNSFEELVTNTRNKAINDFMRFANTMPIVKEEDGEYRPMRLVEIAEQLKAGTTND